MNLFISPVYVTSVENKVDALSHGCLGPASSHLQNKINLPPCLIPFLCGTYLSIHNTLNMSLPPLQLPLIPPVPLKHAHHHAKPKDSIKLSPLHPIVPVAERFIHWLTPFGLYYMDHLSKPFPPSIIAHNCIILSHFVTQKLLSNYTGGLLHFTWFCNNFSVPKTARIPENEALL